MGCSRAHWRSGDESLGIKENGEGGERGQDGGETGKVRVSVQRQSELFMKFLIGLTT